MASPQERPDAHRGKTQDGDLAHRVHPAEVDEDDINDVVPAPAAEQLVWINRVVGRCGCLAGCVGCMFTVCGWRCVFAVVAVAEEEVA